MAAFTLHDRTIDRDRLISGLGVAAVHAALAWALLVGLGAHPAAIVEAPLAVFDVLKPPVPPPPPPREKPAHAPLKSGRASPPNLKSKATEVAAPKPEIVLPLPPPIVTAPTPAQGNDASSGNSNRAGPGTGSGGIGTGSGGWGDGPGGGGGGRPARLVRSGLGGSRCEPGIPCPARTVGIRFTVTTNGRAVGCQVTATSGDPDLDRYTCQKIEERLRYEPARDPSGRKIPQVVNGEHEWLPARSGPDFEDGDD